MKKLTLREVAEACRGTLHGDEAITISSVFTDSRKICDGSLFVPIKGARVDGHDFIPEVMRQGAAAVLSEYERDDAIPYILVESTPQALADLARYYRSILPVKVVGVTGSVGKTSTKEMVASVLSQSFRVLKTEGNYNNEIGLPLTIFRLEAEDEIAVLEMGIDNFGQMNFLANIARPDVAVITNIGYCHLETLGDRDGVYRAKTEIFDYMTGSEAILLNGMDDKLVKTGTVKGIVPRFFGFSDNCSVYADHLVSRGLAGTDCTIHTPQGDFTVKVPIPGEHMVLNAAAATLVGLTFGMTLDNIQKGIAEAETIQGRLRQIQTGQYLVIDDCYNANPVSMNAAIDVLRTAEGRRVAILGDMYELGENEREMHRQTGVHAAESGIDLLFCVGELAAELADGARASVSPNPAFRVFYCPDKESLKGLLKENLKKNDTILVKASNGMGLKEIVSFLTQE